MKLRTLIITTLILILSIFAFTVASADEALPEVTVAVCSDFEPFEYKDAEGNLVGIDIEIISELCSIIGVTPVYMDVEFDVMIPSVRSPLADFAISAITATDTRKKVVDFTDSYISCNVYNPNLDKWYEESYAIPVKIGSEYKDKLNEAIATLKENGKIAEIALKYGLETDENGTYVYKLPKVSPVVSTDYTISDWAKASVETGIKMHWTSPDEFDGDYTTNITRGAFCEIAYNMLRDAVGVETVNLAETSFTDTENTKILYLAQEGIVSGKGDGSYFAPDDFLTRAEAACILYRIAKYCFVPMEEYTSEAFVDDGEIPLWAKDMVYNVVSAKIMSGTGIGFSPMGSYTAEQAVSTIERLYNNIK